MEDGSKINSKNIMSIDDFLKSKLEPNTANNSNEANNPSEGKKAHEAYYSINKERVEILLERNKKLKKFEISQKPGNARKYIYDYRLDTEGFKSFLTANKVKVEENCQLEKIYEKTLKIIDQSKKIKIQKKIFEFYSNYFNAKFNKLYAYMDKKKAFLKKMKSFDFDLKENLERKYIKEYKNLKSEKINIVQFLEDSKIFNLDLIDARIIEFRKSLEAIESKIKALEQAFNKSEENKLDKLKAYKIGSLSTPIENLVNDQFEYFASKIRSFISESNQYDSTDKKTLFIAFLASFEKFWKNINLNEMNSDINKINSIYVTI